MSPVRETLAARFWHLIAVICVVAIIPGDTLAELPSFHAQSPSAQAQSPAAPVKAQAPPTKIPPVELDSLVAPIALYPDPLLAQTLAASTYPLEIIQLFQWLEKHKSLKGKALADAVAKQPWDASVQGLVQYPDVLQRMAGNVQ